MPTPAIELLDHTRNEILRDVVVPYLFSDEALVRYLNEGYRQFARHTHCFIDEAATIDTVADTARYELPADTVYVREVAIGDSYLTGYTRRAKPRRGLSGKPSAYTTDSRHRSIKLYPVPDAVYTVELERAVVPAVITQDDDVDLDHEWAYLLPHWIAYRALTTNDPDGSSTIASRPFYENWVLGVQEAKTSLIRSAMGDNPSAQPRKWT